MWSWRCADARAATSRSTSTTCAIPRRELSARPPPRPAPPRPQASPRPPGSHLQAVGEAGAAREGRDAGDRPRHPGCPPPGRLQHPGLPPRPAGADPPGGPTTLRAAAAGQPPPIPPPRSGGRRPAQWLPLAQLSQTAGAPSTAGKYWLGGQPRPQYEPGRPLPRRQRAGGPHVYILK